HESGWRERVYCHRYPPVWEAGTPCVREEIEPMLVKLEFETTVLPGNRIVVSSPQLPEGKPAKVVITVEEPQPTVVGHVEPDMAESERHFYKDLPRLLQTIPGRWVLYTPQGFLAEGDQERALFRLGAEQGLRSGHFLVARVVEDLPVAEITENWFPPLP